MVPQCGAALAALLVMTSAPQAGPAYFPLSSTPAVTASEKDVAREAARQRARDAAVRRGDLMAAMDLMTPDELAAVRGTSADEAEPVLENVAYKGGLVVRVSVARNRMYVSQDGRPLFDWPVSTAAKGLSTRLGRFRIRALPENVHRVSHSHHNSPMPHAMFYSGGYAIHGTYHTGALGRRASLGCVRLSPQNAATLFELVRAHGSAIASIQHD